MMNPSPKLNASLRWVCRMILCIAIVTPYLGGCSGETDDRNFCSLSCADAKIGSSDFKISPSVKEWNLGCLANGNSPTSLEPFLVQFEVYKEVEGLDGKVKKVPVPAVSMTPLVNGALDSNGTHAELRGDSRFTGIKTGPEEWCTDSCGVFTMEIVPVCLPGVENTITVLARSGSLRPEEPMRISVKNQDSNSEGE